jgi:hypothetical protein
MFPVLEVKVSAFLFAAAIFLTPDYWLLFFRRDQG